MRILILNQFFWPDIAPTGQYLADVARDLVSEGHDVTVICSSNAYGKAEQDSEQAPPVNVIRVGGLPFKRSSLARLFSYFSYFTGALWHAFRVPRHDIIFTMTTPPMLSVIGAMVKAIRGMRHFIWEMDVFPDVMVTTGTLSKGHPVIKLLALIQRTVRAHSDGIIALGPCMKARLIADGTPSELIHVAENWADSRAVTPLPFATNQPLHVLYSGNLGRAHDIGTVADVLRYFRNDKRFLFSFAGSGEGRLGLRELCAAENIRNVTFTGYADREHISEHLASGDIGLVTELPSCLGTVVPSKVYGLMAAGRPILFIGPASATPSLLIDRFENGWHVEPGNARGAIELLEYLVINRHEAERCGANGLAAFNDYYDLPHGVARIRVALGLEGVNASADAALQAVACDFSESAIDS